jgi:Na+-translocating ferredoxin:NAD+ oxidoreductase RnfG subunit
MRQPVIIFLICLASVTARGQSGSEINYLPPSLEKALIRAKQEPEPKLHEMKLPGDLADQISEGRFYSVEKTETSNEIRYVYIGRVNTCRAGVCFADQGTVPEQTSEYFDYFILFNPEGVVQLVRVYNYQATHGQEISAAAWLKQFIGYTSEIRLNTGKNIDAISGATISVDGIMSDIQQKTRILNSFLVLQTKK